MKIHRMADILDALFTADVLARLRKQQKPSRTLVHRIDVVANSVETPEAELSVRTWQRILGARRRAWVDYVTCMDDAGFLDTDVKARLTGVDDDDFRPALSECLTCHFLRCILGLTVFGRHEGRPGTAIDFGVKHADGDLSVEVKSPFAEKPEGSYWGDHSHILTPVLDTANKQFADGRKNVVALVPLVEWPVLHGRAPYVKAFFGEEKIVFTVDKQNGGMVGEPYTRFIAEGKFLKLWPEPRFTRTAIRERMLEENVFEEHFTARVELSWFVLHNPYAPQPIPSAIWGECAQLVRDGEVIRWTDGASIDGTVPKRD